MPFILEQYLRRTSRRDALRGVGLTAAAVFAIEILVRIETLTIPNPVALVVIPVIYASFSGGMVAGLLASLVAIFYGAYFFSMPGTILQFDPDNTVRIAAMLVVTPAIALMASAMRENIARAHEVRLTRETENRTKAESSAAASRRSEQMLRLVTNTIPARIAYIDADERYVMCNRLYCDAFGFAEDSVIGQKVLDIIGEQLYKVAKVHIDGALAGESISYERSERTPDGELRVLTVNYVPHLDTSGEALGFIAMIIDITAQTLATDALRDSEEKLRVMADSLPVLISYFDNNQIYRFSNRMHQEWIGSGEKRIVGHTVREILGDAAYDGGLGRAIAAALAGGTVKFERSIVHDGTMRQLDGTLVPHTDASGGVAGVFVLVIDISVRKALEDKLAHMAQHDHLTQLPNRALFEDRLQQALERSNRSKEPFTLMYLDIDHFKSINDTLGHQSGDDLLRQFSSRLSACTRSADTVARMGGDEFVMLMEGPNSHGAARRIAENILRSVRKPVELGQCTINVTASIGIALVQGGEMTRSEAIAKADAALYRAKAGGRNTFHID